MTAADRLLLVYNADAGIVAGLFDLIHKALSPATYPCSLCGVTYGPLGMDKRWRAYLEALPMPIVFYHRPDFYAAYPAFGSEPRPLIAAETGGTVTVLLDAVALAPLTTVDALIAALDARLGS